MQAVQKGTMGAPLFKEGIALLDKVPTADNNTVTLVKEQPWPTILTWFLVILAC